MTILSAKFANPSRTAIEIQTKESGSVLIQTNGEDVSGGWRAVYDKWKESGETAAYTPLSIDPIKLAKAHVGRSFDTLELLTLKDWKDALPPESTPKLQACYIWIQNVIASAMAGETVFPAPPHNFSAVIGEVSQIQKP